MGNTITFVTTQNGRDTLKAAIQVNNCNMAKVFEENLNRWYEQNKDRLNPKNVETQALWNMQINGISDQSLKIYKLFVSEMCETLVKP